ncbi:kinase-like protein [Parathielavia hyrcaniae]|uniref:mitogen-activated protein kinase kinase n=1 Tax=Parathielavia hyrcaniae TaxID=113614 RepID=A0AAN6T3Y0_9PEZI|nr:kinase-like protein [Parathielavia hyrcaniae]
MIKCYDGYVDCMGILMDLATSILVPRSPGDPPAAVTIIQPSQRRDIMHQMIRLVERLHDEKRIVHRDLKPDNMLLDKQGKLRLCDFAEGRYVDEDLLEWEGATTWHYESPNRLWRGQQMRMCLPPPTIEDDVYALGLSIWSLYTGKVPNDDLVGDDDGLKERQQQRGTVDVAEVDDPEAREIIRGFRRGGALV